MKEVTAEIQTKKPVPVVTNSVGIRRKVAMPIQKREKRSAATKETSRVPMTKEVKRRSGVAERRT